MDITKYQTEHILIVMSSITAHANTFIANELKANGIVGIHPSHGAVIGALIESEEPLPLPELVRTTGRVKSTITVTVKTLEKHGYVKRFKKAGNKKSVFVKLTPKGRNIEEKVRYISRQLIEKVYGDIPISEREQLMTSLGKIQQNIAN